MESRSGEVPTGLYSAGACLGCKSVVLGAKLHPAKEGKANLHLLAKARFAAALRMSILPRELLVVGTLGEPHSAPAFSGEEGSQREAEMLG